MKTPFFVLATLLAFQAHAEIKGGSDVNSGSIPEVQVLECFTAMNPQDASIDIHNKENVDKIDAQETVLSLHLQTEKFAEHNRINQLINAQTQNFSYVTGGGHIAQQGPGKIFVECDGGGWQYKRTKSGDMIVTQLSASGEVKKLGFDGCDGLGILHATNPLNFKKVSCEK